MESGKLKKALFLIAIFSVYGSVYGDAHAQIEVKEKSEFCQAYAKKVKEQKAKGEKPDAPWDCSVPGACDAISSIRSPYVASAGITQSNGKIEAKCTESGICAAYRICGNVPNLPKEAENIKDSGPQGETVQATDAETSNPNKNSTGGILDEPPPKSELPSFSKDEILPSDKFTPPTDGRTSDPKSFMGKSFETLKTISNNLKSFDIANSLKELGSVPSFDTSPPFANSNLWNTFSPTPTFFSSAPYQVVSVTPSPLTSGFNAAPLFSPDAAPIYGGTPSAANSAPISTFSNSSPFPWQSSNPGGSGSGSGLTGALPAMWESAKAAWDKMASYLSPPQSALANPDLAFPIAPETTLDSAINDAIAGEAFNLPPLAPTTDALMESLSKDIDPNPFVYDTDAARQARANLQNEVDAVNDKVGQLLSGNPSADDILTAKALAEVNKEVTKTLLDTRSSWQGVRDWLGVAKSPQKIAAEIAEAQLQQVAQAEAGAKIDLARNAYVLGPDASKPLGLAALSNGTKVQDDLTTEGPVAVNPDGTSRPLTPAERKEYDGALEKLGGEIMESRKIPPEALKELGDLIKVGAPTKLPPDSNVPGYDKSLPNDQSRESIYVEDKRAENADPTWSLIDEKGEVTGAVNTSKLVDEADTFSGSNLPPLAKTVEELKASLEGPTGGRNLTTIQEAQQIAREDLRVAQEALINDRSLVDNITDTLGITESQQLADVNAAQERVDTLNKLASAVRVDNMISDMQARADTLRQTAQEVRAAADATNRAVDIASTPIERLSSGVPKEIAALPPSEMIRAEDVSSTEIAGCDGIMCMARETASSAWDSLKAAGGYVPDVNKLGSTPVVPTAYLPGLGCGTAGGCDTRIEGLFETKYENPLGWKNAADNPFAPNGNTPITLDDVAAARAKGFDIPVTVAAQNGREGDAFLIPKVSWRSITDGEMHTEENVRAVVTDNGGAFNAGGCATWGTCADIEYKIDVPTGNFEYVTRADAQGYDRGSNFSTSGTWQKIETPSSADLTQSYPTAPSPWGDSSVQVAGLENSHIVSLGAGGVSPGVLLAEVAPSNMSPFALYGSPTAASPSISVASMDIGTAVYGPGGGPYDISTGGGYYGLPWDTPALTSGGGSIPSDVIDAQAAADASGGSSGGSASGNISPNRPGVTYVPTNADPDSIPNILRSGSGRQPSISPFDAAPVIPVTSEPLSDITPSSSTGGIWETAQKWASDTWASFTRTPLTDAGPPTTELFDIPPRDIGSPAIETIPTGSPFDTVFLSNESPRETFRPVTSVGTISETRLQEIASQDVPEQVIPPVPVRKPVTPTVQNVPLPVQKPATSQNVPLPVQKPSVAQPTPQEGSKAPSAQPSGSQSPSGSGSSGASGSGNTLGGGSSGGGGSGGSSASGGGSGSGFLQGGLSLLGSLFQSFKDFFGGGSQDGQGKTPQAPTQPSQPAPSVQIVGTIVGNPSIINSGEKSLLSWSSVGTDVSSSTCAVINAQFQVLKRGGQDGTEWSPPLTESTRFGLVCNVRQASEKLLNETLVRVRGDETDHPRIFSNPVSAQGTVTGSGSSAPSSGTSGSSGGSSGSGGQSGNPTPDDVRTCDPDQSMDSFIICLCEAEPNPAGCTIPPGGL